ncbi:hypothetical protein [Mobilicoccus massiliensis]|uniref:hypothetical protein n=1 Tax=Mobilicoccus massiliensis TaxID=1522310 RepID=UPI00058EFE6F|nr:hypothetical protein [Mobilicoccus massiliensis]
MRRIRLALLTLSTALALGACSGIPPEPSVAGQSAGGGAPGAEQQTPTPTPTPKELPQGGRQIFPAYRLVGYSGIKGSGPGLGRAGVGNIDDRMTEMVERAQPYGKDGRKIMPVLEYIATMVHPCKNAPKCRTASTDDKIQEHLDAVRKVDGILLLAIQPGRSDFLTEVKRYEKFLKEPDVGLALDPEWRMGPNQEPMHTFGSTDAKELNQVSAYVEKLVADNDLPEKVLLYHMIRVNWVRNHDELKPRPGVAFILSVDGIGDQKLKEGTWKSLMAVKPPFVHPGFKLFYQEDTAGKGWKLMTPEQVMALTPTPEYVLYE